MKNLILYFCILAFFMGCVREKNTIEPMVPLSCGHASTLLNLQVMDFYTGQPVQYSTKITELEAWCDWCLQPQVIANLASDSLGVIRFDFQHDSDPDIYYRTSLIPEERYKFPRIFDLSKGCEMNYKVRMKPAIDLCISIQNVSNRPMPINSVYVNTVFNQAWQDPQVPHFYGIDSDKILVSDTLAVGAEKPYWLKSLPEENIRVSINYFSSSRREEMIQTKRGSEQIHRVYLY
ncbi:MAG: hypothetical protein ACKVU0_07875 [Saprospiraceae bacterium]